MGGRALLKGCVCVCVCVEGEEDFGMGAALPRLGLIALTLRPALPNQSLLAPELSLIPPPPCNLEVNTLTEAGSKS